MEPQHTDPPPLLTRDEVARRLRMEVRTLRRLIEAGEFPRPLQVSPGVVVWTAADVAAHEYRIANRGRFRAKRPPKANPGPPKAKPRPPADKQ